MKTSTIASVQKEKKRKTTSLPSSTVEYLKAWMMSPEHINHPYPTEKEKAQIMADTGIELKQLTNWFVNNRKRYWKPRVEARLKQQVQVQSATTVAAIASHQRNSAEASRVGLLSTQTNGSVHNTRRQTQQVLSGNVHNKMNTVHQVSPSNHDRAKYGSHYSQVANSFQSIPNKLFMSPSGSSTNDNSVQVISMGSASTFSDCDSSSGSHEESNQDHVISFGGFISPQNNQSSLKQSPSKKRDRTMIIANAIAHSLDGGESTTAELMKDQDTPSLTTLHRIPQPSKRIRLVSDYDVYPSPAQIIARPRSLPFNNSSYESPSSLKVKPTSWQSACRMASHGYDSTLPTLEEAALLFGFATKK